MRDGSGIRTALHRTAAVTTTVALVLGGLATGVTTTIAAHAGQDGVVAFTRTTDASTTIWTADANGADSAPVDISWTSVNEAELLGIAGPSWAPDGQHLAIGMAFNCAYGPTCGAEIGMVDITDGTGRQLTCDGAVASPGSLNECRTSQYGASVSPDGARVAFATDQWADSAGTTIVPHGSLMTVLSGRVCTASTADPEAPFPCDSVPVQLTDDPNATYGAPGAWTPNGDWLITLRSQFHPSISEDLVAVRTDGSGDYVVLVEGSTGPFVAPDVSPDGTTVIVTKASGSAMGLYTFPIDCDVSCAATDDPELLYEGTIYGAVYSPSGTQVAVDFGVTPAGGTDEIWTLTAAGSDPQAVITHEDPGPADHGPSWQPVRNVAPPVATNQSITTAEDTATVFALAVTDTTGETLDYDVGDPAHGTISGTAPNLTYTPAADTVGPDSFTWSVSNSAGSSAPATVSITVTAVNDPPTAHDLTVRVQPGGTVNILLSGSDPEGAPLTFEVVTPPTVGRIQQTTSDPSTVTYKAPRSFSGTSFTYQASDGTHVSNIATVTILPNQPPTADDALVRVIPGEATPITLTGSDPDGDPLTFAVTHPPSHGTLSGTAPTLVYTPNPGFTGLDYFGFTVSDGAAISEITAVDVCVQPEGASCIKPRRRTFR